jgi:rhamnosyltransferase
MNEPRVYCVLVTYHPKEPVLREVLDSISHQATGVIVVDNTEGFEPPLEVGAAQYLRLGQNLGIAAAQNKGIALALSQGADYIWLSDQDTLYPSGFVSEMLSCAATCKARGIPFAALAPAFLDTLAGRVRPFIRHSPFIRAFIPTPGPNAVSDAIASGTLIPSGAMHTVGLMQEDLFIDWVDIEWCWRARNIHGLQIIGVGDVLIQHALGDGMVAFGGRTITIRSPIRHYYITRNAVYLAIHSSAPTAPIRIQITLRALMWTLGYPIVAPSRKWDHLRACCRGLWHGLIKRMGRLT